MSNLSKKKRQRMFEMLARIRKEHRGDDETLSAINEIENELNAKKYGLVWEEHEEAVNVQMRTHIPVFTEDMDKEITTLPEQDYNFLLEGDNLHSLYLLEKTHRGRIDVIYIDPPYNTGKKGDFIYDDCMIDKNDSYRHSKWISFISERLKMAKRLLSEQGIIFISIDDNEHSALKLLCDSILGEHNYITSLIWQKKKGGSNDSRHVATEHEYIIMYANNVDLLNNIFIEYDNDYVSRYKEKDEIGRYFWDTFKRKSGKQYYPITCPDGTVLQYEENGEPISWLRSEARFLSDLKAGETRIIKVNGKWTVHFKQRQPKGYKPRSLVTEYGTTSSGAEQLKQIFNITNKFSNPKPSTLISFLIKFCPDKNATILDFFAGSGTTAQAVLELNKQDGGNRKFILCTNNENNICTDVTYPRIKTVISGKRQDDSIYSDGIPTNLKYYRTDFVARDCEYLSDELLEHIEEMIQLENGVKIDGSQYIMLLDEQDADELVENWKNYSDVKTIYVAKDVLFTTEQAKIFANVDIKTIPDYYFEFDLRQEGESW